MEHPRWGIIQTVTAIEDIKEGEELFTYYGYKKQDFPADHEWYWELEKLFKREKEEGKKGKKWGKENQGT